MWSLFWYVVVAIVSFLSFCFPFPSPFFRVSVLSSSEKAMAPHSSTLAWKIPWVEEPGRLQSMGLGRVGHDWATSLSLFTFLHWRRKWQPTPVFFPENPRDGGACWAAIYGVTQSQTWLKWLHLFTRVKGLHSLKPGIQEMAPRWIYLTNHTEHPLLQ